MDVYDKINSALDSVTQHINTQFEDFIINEFETEYKKISDTEYKAICRENYYINKNKVVELLHKDIPKKVITIIPSKYGNLDVKYKCPNCHVALPPVPFGSVYSEEYKHCFNCGQKLDWSYIE